MTDGVPADIASSLAEQGAGAMAGRAMEKVKEILDREVKRREIELSITGAPEDDVRAIITAIDGSSKGKDTELVTADMIKKALEKATARFGNSAVTAGVDNSSLPRLSRLVPRGHDFI